MQGLVTYVDDINDVCALGFSMSSFSLHVRVVIAPKLTDNGKVVLSQINLCFYLFTQVIIDIDILIADLINSIC